MNIFAKCVSDKYKSEEDTILAYRKYYANDKAHLFKYTKRQVPEWFEEITN